MQFPNLDHLPKLEPPQMREIVYPSSLKKIWKEIEVISRAVQYRLFLMNNGAMPAPALETSWLSKIRRRKK